MKSGEFGGEGDKSEEVGEWWSTAIRAPDLVSVGGATATGRRVMGVTAGVRAMGDISSSLSCFSASCEVCEEEP